MFSDKTVPATRSNAMVLYPRHTLVVKTSLRDWLWFNEHWFTFVDTCQWHWKDTKGVNCQKWMGKSPLYNALLVQMKQMRYAAAGSRLIIQLGKIVKKKIIQEVAGDILKLFVGCRKFKISTNEGKPWMSLPYIVSYCHDTLKSETCRNRCMCVGQLCLGRNCRCIGVQYRIARLRKR